MIAIVHTKDDHHYIIENVEMFEVITPKGIVGTQIPEDECQTGFRFKENDYDTTPVSCRNNISDDNNTYSTSECRID